TAQADDTFVNLGRMPRRVSSRPHAVNTLLRSLDPGHFAQSAAGQPGQPGQTGAQPAANVHISLNGASAPKMRNTRKEQQ
ncbi:hypothetical protein KIH79_12160, partial [Bifidobacterium sp. 82T10]